MFSRELMVLKINIMCAVNVSDAYWFSMYKRKMKKDLNYDRIEVF